MRITEPNKLVEARAVLKKAEFDLGDPDSLSHLRNGINSLVQLISGSSPRIEKDIAKKLVLTCRRKVLLEVKGLLQNEDSHRTGSLAHWNKVMEAFVEASLADDPEFEQYKERLAACRDTGSVAHPPRDSQLKGDCREFVLLSRPTVAPQAQPTISARGSGLNPDNFKAAHVSIPTKELPPTDRHNDCARVVDQGETVTHAKSLAAIGHSLEMLRLQAFRLEKTGEYYKVRSDSLTRTHQWILSNLSQKTLGSPVNNQKGGEITMGDGWFCVGPREIVRWSGRERKRDNRGLEPREADNLAQRLGTLGEYLDSKKATTFEISWAPDLVSVEYVTRDVIRECKDFTVEKLQQLASYSSRLQK